MSLVVDIEKHYGTFDLEVAFEAAHETLGFLGASGLWQVAHTALHRWC